MHISIDCKCNETVRDGYGMCRKRSSRLGGNFFCAVDNDSKCKDIKKEPNTGISVSVDACKHINIGRVPSNFRFYVLINKFSENCNCTIYNEYDTI